jgi:signal transduction histidine kinase
MGRDIRMWPMLCLLLIVVLLPTACLLWMMTRAIDNERAAVRQVLAEACRGQLVRLQRHCDEQWRTRAEQLQGATAGKPPQEAFAAIVRGGLADSAIVCDQRRRPLYPAPPGPPAERPAEDAGWAQAEQLEHVARNPTAAAAAYAALAKGTADADVAARAILAQARCLAQAGNHEKAIDFFVNTLAGKRFARASDADGRLIVADAELRALELIGDPADARFHDIAARLAARLVDYLDPLLRSPQRRFLLRSLGRLSPETASFAMLDAEDLAAACLESGAALADGPTLEPSGVPRLWQFRSAAKGEGAGQVVALFRTKTIFAELQRLAAEENLPAGMSIQLLPPQETVDLADFLYVLPAGAHQPGWQLAIQWNDESVVGATTHGKIAAYCCAGVFAVLATSLLAFWIAMRFRRQMRLARLKNDLVAAVSHELKTPLASIRLLVDTLLASDEPDRQRLREYLELVAKENARLGRLIDNFLTFSRMERNKHAFTPSEITPADVVAAAAHAVGERFQRADCRFEVRVEPDLPPIFADADAMTTALVNLLDNAYKYTEDDKHIAVRAYTGGDWVFFEVTDNGIGLSRTACRRVFERFYQVDRELSRSRGGCGLGLSIVEFIAREHGGRVSVRSQPGQGSTFTIALRRAADARRSAEQQPPLPSCRARQADEGT